MNDLEFKVMNNTCTFYVDSRIYALNTIMKTAYVFIENYYVFFKYVNDHTIQVELKGKQQMDNIQLEHMAGEFYNELLNQCLRLEIFDATKNLREMIIGRALYNTCIDVEEDIEQTREITEFVDDTENYLDSEEDILNIGVNWADRKNNGSI